MLFALDNRYQLKHNDIDILYLLGFSITLQHNK